MVRVGALFENNAFLAVSLAAFTPIPFKVFTIAGGFFSISLPIFLIASIIGRFARFLFVGYLAKRYGRRALGIIYRHFNYFGLGLGVLALIYMILRIL